ncbi:glycoside hydrolase family 127 protein, partial [bacterium]|nr:glycoside hydrolase family 127 protein [bacterium]
SYAQQHKPVIEQTEPVGHAVRAVYMYSAMADIAALTGEKSYIKAIDTIWENMVNKKMSLTGGLGAETGIEGFGNDYDLPNLEVYNETCAAIANMFLNHRMFLLHGDAKYLDVFERVLYNGFLAGVNVEGNRFFYTNPLEADGKYVFNHGKKERSEWFGCACCPVNIVRTMAQLPGYMYAHDNNNLYVCLYGQSKAIIPMPETKVEIEQATEYPWNGKIIITVNPEKKTKFSLRVRIPGWSQDQPVPGELYSVSGGTPSPASLTKQTITLNNKKINPGVINGFAVIDREWNKGDIVKLDIPMPVKKIKSHPNIKYNKNKIAFERGPIIYCAEEIDNKVKTQLIYIPEKAELNPVSKKDVFGEVTALQGKAHAFVDGNDKEIQFTAIPYYAWNHRGIGSMSVWFSDNKKITKQASIAETKRATTGKVTASYFCPSDPPSSILDEYEPKSSRDGQVSRCTFWPHKGTEEWLQITFPKKRIVSTVSVYWFDDIPTGGCKVPESWSLEYKDNGKWNKFPVYITDDYRDFKDQYNVVHAGKEFETDALRIKIKLRKDFSGGIIKCIIE